MQNITEIEDLVNYKCMELSDGQLQRVMIARALAQDTPFILLDEPTTHLDIYHRAYLLKLLKKLAVEKQKTIMFSTQEIDLAIQVSNKMIVMTEDKVHFDEPNKLIELGCFNDSSLTSPIQGFASTHSSLNVGIKIRFSPSAIHIHYRQYYKKNRMKNYPNN